MGPILDLYLKSVLFPYRNYRVKYDLSLSLNGHGIIGLYGACGSGKSTICKVSAGIIPFEEKAEIEGGVAWKFPQGDYLLKDLESPTEIYRNIGYVNQNPEKNFICEFVIDELVFNMEMRGYSEEYIYEKLDYIFQKYDLEHLLNKRLTELSGGEKQLISVVSSILHKPNLLILDEPTAQLDGYWRDCIAQHLRFISKAEELGILVSSHQYSFLESLGGAIISLTPSKNLERKSLPVDFPTKNGNAKYSSLSVSDLNIHRNHQHILKDVTFELFSGDSVLILGKNGSGKSSLLEALSGLIKVKSGKIHFSKKSSHLTPRGLQMVFQNPDHQIFTDCVLSELELGLRFGDYSHDEKTSSVETFLNNLQFLDNQEDADPRQLSWGQKKIMNILISFCLLDFEKGILLLDEPDLALDTNHIFKLSELVRKALDLGLTIITVTHNWKIYQNLFNRVFVIRDSCVKELENFERGNLNELQL